MNQTNEQFIFNLSPPTLLRIADIATYTSAISSVTQDDVSRQTDRYLYELKYPSYFKENQAHFLINF